MFTNRMRMTGFSGIDVADMVHQMMRAESFRLDRLRQQRDLNVWRQDMMRNVATSINQFQRRWTSALTTSGSRNIGDPNNWNSNTSTITGVRLGGGVAVGATTNVSGAAKSGTHQLHVISKAQSHTFQTQGKNFNNDFPGAKTNMIDFSRLIDRRVEIPDPSDTNTPPAKIPNPDFGNFNNFSFAVNVNGVTRNIVVDGSVLNGMISQTDREAIATRLNDITTRQAEMNAHIAGGGSTTDSYYTDRQALNDADRALNEAAFTAALSGPGSSAFESAINTGLAQFGTNIGGTVDRIRAELTGGELRFIVGEGNTASILNGNLNTFEMGLTSVRTGGAVNAAFNTNYNLADFLNSNTMDFTINGRNFEVRLDPSLAEADRGIFVNGTRVTPEGKDLTVQDLMNAVNNSGAGVNMSFSNLSQEFTFRHNQTGALNTITLGGSSGDFLNAFGLVQTQTAEDAIIRIKNNNGAWSGDMSRESNTILLADGVSITLSDAVEDGDIFTVEVTRNTNDVRQMIIDFVEEYNALVRSMVDLTEVRRPRQDGGNGFFMPLTEEQRREMSDREIEQWEEQARKGILHRDDTLRTIQREMTDVLFRNITVDGRTFNLGNMGIQLSRDISEFGMLTIDMDRFDDALENRMDDFRALFTTHGGFGASVNDMGLADRLSHVFNRATSASSGTITRRAGTANNGGQDDMSRIIAADNRRIDNMLSWLQRREDSLFAQFSRMEAAMMQANSQMMFFEQLMWGNM